MLIYCLLKEVDRKDESTKLMFSDLAIKAEGFSLG
jgi:hypothetical protein